MRIIGGFHKGRRIKSVSGNLTRPTTDFVREALFNIISNEVIDSCFLDLFAGTGAVGLEALSRGAKKVVFIEKNPHAFSVIEKNLQDLKLINKAELIQKDATLALTELSRRNYMFDIVFMDPPYYENHIEECLDILRASKLVKSLVIVQHPKDETIDFTGFLCYKKKVYGKTTLTFLQKE